MLVHDGDEPVWQTLHVGTTLSNAPYPLAQLGEAQVTKDKKGKQWEATEGAVTKTICHIHTAH